MTTDAFIASTDPTALPAAAINGAVALTDLGVIRATGEDAVKFLQGQLTQDVALLPAGQARLAAFCNPKGRMQASFIMFKRRGEAGDEVLLVCSRDILAQTLKRLSMFVMRAKARLVDATADFALYGLAGDAVRAVAPEAQLWQLVDAGAAQVAVLHPGAAQPRALWCAPADAAAPDAPAITMDQWHWLGVRSGVALITQPIFEAFVPQMLNYESTGGVNFKKGCYPGQEIVARSQFRGTLKRRAYVLHIADDAAQPTVGQEVFHAGDSEQPCGQVAAAAPNASGGFDVIVSMQTSAAADGGPLGGAPALTLGSPTGPAMRLLPLPYVLLDDI